MKNKYTLSIIAGLLAGYTAITPGISRAEIAAGGAGDTAKEPTPLPKRVSVHTECIPGQKIDTTVTDTDGTGRTITYVCPSSGKKKKAVELIGVDPICGTLAFNTLHSGVYQCLTPAAAGKVGVTPLNGFIPRSHLTPNPERWCPVNTLCYKLPEPGTQVEITPIAPAPVVPVAPAETPAPVVPTPVAPVAPVKAPTPATVAPAPSTAYQTVSQPEVTTTPVSKWTLEGLVGVFTNGDKSPDVTVGVRIAHALGYGFDLGVVAGYLHRTAPGMENNSPKPQSTKELLPDGTTYKNTLEIITDVTQENAKYGYAGLETGYRVAESNSGWFARLYVGVQGLIGSKTQTVDKIKTTGLERNQALLGEPKTITTGPQTESRVTGGAYANTGVEVCTPGLSVGSARLGLCARVEGGYDTTQAKPKAGGSLGLQVRF